MTDINTELERIADETLGNPLEEAQDGLDMKGDPRAPTKGAAKAQKEAKIEGGTPGGETQDMGPAVVSPEAKSDPGDAATKKAKKATPPGKAGGKGLSSDASTVAVGDGSGEMKVGAREEVELEGVDPEEKDLAAARKAEKKKAGKGGGTAGRPQEEPDEDEEDGEKEQDDLDKDDEEEGSRSKKRPTAEERVAEIDLSSDVEALTSGEGLSE